ncbi:MAG TPA: glycoside hydrolase family 28 protein [Verrucomicrobiae bacterium]|nr:glycoside hydrolase family 28 protein [Verrucomicrobiae bacterium]
MKSFVLRAFRTPFLVAMILLASVTARGANHGPFFNVLDYGAQNDGSTNAADAIRSAIQAAHAVGGGTVYFPPGTYVTGPLELVNNLTLFIDAGATLRFPATKLPFTKGRQQGIECLTPVPLIGGHDLQNVTITGRGLLTTDNKEWMKLMPRTRRSGINPGSANGPNWERLLQELEIQTPAPDEFYQKAAPELRPSFVRTMDSTNVLIEGVHFVGSSMWTIHLLYTDNAVVRNVVIETYPGVHTDGIAVDSSRNVRISDCYIDTGDDGIVIKSGKDADGRRVNKPTENVSISNCTVHHAHGAVTLGSEIAGGIRNLVADNITCDGTQMGVRIKSRRGRGGFVENVRFNNWTMQNVGQAINVTSYYIMEGETRTGPQPVSEKTPVFRNIAISAMTVEGARVAINVEGLPEMPIKGLRISDVIASAKVGMKASNTEALELHNVRVKADRGPAFLAQDSKELELDGVATRKPLAGTPVVRLDRCPGAIVRNSRAFAGTDTFLSVGPGELKTIALEGNVLDSAKKAMEESPGSEPTREPPTED